ncbi:MAG TPA: carbohydrate kinase [Betaproteobacteria bacterium]|nr:carbohydrate kinase [Betaproteobacteria bacterium]
MNVTATGSRDFSRSSSGACALGVDFGTSGARAVIVDAQGAALAEIRQNYPASNPEHTVSGWRSTLFFLLSRIPPVLRRQLRAIAIDGASATVLLCNSDGRILLPPLLYYDSRAAEEAAFLRTVAPPGQAVLSPSSSLAKLLWFSKQSAYRDSRYLVHQADWLAFLLHGQAGVSDYHNSLKLGYDPERLRYPDWLRALPVASRLPRILAPGAPIGPVMKAIAARFSLPADCIVRAGTTDSIAAFLASGACRTGQAVTSLGSTLVLKVLSKRRVDAADYGVYSHRLDDLWLAGGASNSGGAILRQFFSDARIKRLSARIDPERPSALDYYPLLRPGERFPLNDPALPPRLSPRPTDDAVFLQGLLEGIARIEADGYRLLTELGATPVTEVFSAGGGADNPIWTRIRQRLLHVMVRHPPHTEAAYGVALLALNGKAVAPPA